MISRRQLLGQGLGACAAGWVLAPATGVTAVLAADAVGPAARHLLIEPRFAAMQGLLAGHAAADAQRYLLQRDLLPLWHEVLLPALQSGTDDVAFAGLTGERPLWLLRTLAAGQRLRLLSCSTPAARVAGEPLQLWLLGRGRRA